MYESRIQWIDYKGVKIMYQDWNGLSPEQTIVMLKELGPILSKEPVGSILCVADYTNLHFSINLLNEFKKASAEQDKYYKAAAFIGIKGLVRVMYDTVAKLLKQEMKLFDKKEEALEWIITKA